MKICPKCQTKFKQNESFCPQDGSRLQDLAPEKKGGLAGGTLDNVARLETLLTADAMAERYSGILVDENQPTWITVFNQQFVPISEAKKRMETARSLVGAPLPKEINIALRSNFEHTPSYIIHSEPAGPSVRELLEKEERLPWELAAKIIASTARVLEWLHEHGILFRAIHPGAIYVSDVENGKVQIAEWAYDSLMDINSPLEALKEDENAFVGYVNYLAPELAEGFEYGDVRSTVYALGILLYEMITGIAPMKAATPAEILSRHKLEKPLPIQLAVPSAKFHPDLSEILDRMLSKKRENRFQTPGTIIAVLSNLLNTTPIELAPKLRRTEMREDELFQTIDMESVDRSSIPELAPLKKEVQEIKKTIRERESKRKTLMMSSIMGNGNFDAKPSIEVNFGEDTQKSIEVNFDPEPEPKKTMHFINPVLEAPEADLKKREEEEASKKREEEAAKKREEEAAKKREEAEAAKKREEEETAKKREEEVAAKKREDEEAAKKREEEDAAKKREDEEAAKKREEEEAAKKREEEDAAKKREEEDAAKKSEEEDAAKKREEEDEAKKREEEDAVNKREEEDAANKREEEAAKKREDEEAAKKREEEDAAKKREEENAAKKREEEDAAKKREEEDAAKKSEEEDAAKKREEEAATKKREEKKSAKKRKEKKAAKKRNGGKKGTPKKTVHFIKKEVIQPGLEVVGEFGGNSDQGGNAPDAEWFATSKDEAWERSFEREGVEDTETQQRRIGLIVIIGAVLLGLATFIYVEFIYEPEPDPADVSVAAAVIPKSKSDVLNSDQVDPSKTEETLKLKTAGLASKFSEAMASSRFISPPGNSASSYLEELGNLAPHSERYKTAKADFIRVVLEKSKSMPIEASMNLVREAKNLNPENQELKARFTALNAELAGIEKPEEKVKDADKKEDDLTKTEKAEKIDPKEKGNAKELIKKAKSAYSRNQSAAAKKLFLEAYAIVPSDHRVTAGLGAIYYDAGNYAKSVTYYKKAVSRSGSTKYRISLGQSYFRLGRNKSAIKVWKAALKKSPNNETIKKYIKLAERKLR